VTSQRLAACGLSNQALQHKFISKLYNHNCVDFGKQVDKPDVKTAKLFLVAENCLLGLAPLHPGTGDVIKQKRNRDVPGLSSGTTSLLHTDMVYFLEQH
jgi:hypothetical protein